MEKNIIYPRGVDSAKVILVIETKSLRGAGTGNDPARIVTQYWSLEGEFLAEADIEHCIPVIKHEAKSINPITTNADTIRAMSDEKLAGAIMCPNDAGLADIECNHEDWRDCQDCCLKWLKEETK